MKEKIIENYLCEQVRTILHGIPYKFTSPGRRSVPDRMCVVNGHIFFVECKATDKQLTDAQARERRRLQDKNQWVYMVNSKHQVNIIITFWERKLREEGTL